MKIAVEADGLAHDPQTGVYTYTQQLIAKAAELSPAHNYELVYFGAANDGRIGVTGPNIKRRNVWWFPRKLYNALLRTPFGLPFDAVTATSADVYFFPRFARWPLLRQKPSVVVIHDTAYLEYPAMLKTQHFRRYLTKAVPRTLKHATQVVAISDSTRQSLVKHYDISPNKIAVVSPALDHKFYKPADAVAVAALKSRYGITRDYLLYVGAQEPRKNIAGMLRAYQSLPAELRAKYQLVIGGGTSWNNQEAEAEAAKLVKDELAQIGFVAAADLPVLYSGAALFLYPSLYEGWGMQVLEAQACGTPVLTADNSSLLEVGGGAAEYVKTGDQADLNTKLAALLANPKRLEQLRAQGLEHAAEYTWEKSAKKLLEIFAAVTK